MKREEIENRDQELTKKFRTIIHNKKKKNTPVNFPFGWMVLFLFLVLSSVIFFKQKPDPPFPEDAKPQSKPQSVTVPAEQPQPILNLATSETKSPSDSDLITPVLEPNPSAATSDQNGQSNMPPGIRIEEIISCASVTNKQYRRPKTRFSLAQDAAPKIWMEVVSQNPPFTLTHVYYCNGQKYCEVPLAIRYPRMRTWSSVTLGSADHIGNWRVEVIDGSGAILDQIEFAVVN